MEVKNLNFLSTAATPSLSIVVRRSLSSSSPWRRWWWQEHQAKQERNSCGNSVRQCSHHKGKEIPFLCQGRSSSDALRWCIMDMINAEQACIAKEAGACAVPAEARLRSEVRILDFLGSFTLKKRSGRRSYSWNKIENGTSNGGQGNGYGNESGESGYIQRYRIADVGHGLYSLLAGLFGLLLNELGGERVGVNEDKEGPEPETKPEPELESEYELELKNVTEKEMEKK